MIIKEATASIIKNSQNKKTIEIKIGQSISSSPAGESTGKYEEKSYNKTIEEDIKHINNTSINTEIKNFEDLVHIEKLFKNKIGANSLFALESCILKEISKNQNKELYELLNNKSKKFPRILSNTIGGGKHNENNPANKPEFQEFLVSNDNNPEKGRRINQQVHKKAGILLEKIEGKIKRDHENAWQTSLNNEDCLNVLRNIYPHGFLGIDLASSEFFNNKKYLYKDKKLSKKEQINHIKNIIKKYNISYIEDPLNEEDFSGFAELLKEIKKEKIDCLIVGDDLTTTNPKRVKRAIKENSINGIIIKPNQIGSLIKTKEVIDLCKKNNIQTIISHRGQETTDNTIADLGFAWGCDFIKVSVIGKERLAKVKRLEEIEENLK